MTRLTQRSIQKVSSLCKKNHRLLVLVVAMHIIAGCNTIILGQESAQKYTINSFPIEVNGDLNGFTLAFTSTKVKEGVEVATLKLTRDSAAPPPKLELKWSLPSNDISGHWTTRSGLKKNIQPDWWPSQVTSSMARNAPVLTLFGSAHQNRLTVAASDALNTVKLTTSIREEDGFIYNQAVLFTSKHKAVTNFEIELYFDTRDQPFYTSLKEVAAWWASKDAYKPAKVPEHALLPMYSTWYSYHQNVNPTALLKECTQAKKMGFESIIVDDGWQTLDNKRGYAYTGDWKPERIPEMKKFVEGVHALDMKFLLWYALPLVGEKSEAYKKLEGKFLRYWDGQGAYELDPRYPESRKHVIDICVKALEEWNLDGFKLDFIGRWVARKHTVLEAKDGRDFASVNEAADRLMTDLIKKLTSINPDIMIEFRQPYIGPLMRKYGNIFRAGDCPNSTLENRVRTTDLRMLSGTTAVHSDMIMWHYEEQVEVAAFQLLNVLYAVPQISVRLEDIPNDHLKMMQFYLDYWAKNQKVLLEGDFEAPYPLQHYPMLVAGNKDKKIITLYSDQYISLAESLPSSIDIINAKNNSTVMLNAQKDLGTYIYTIYNCLGVVQRTGEIDLKQQAHAIEIPVSGLVSLERKK